MNSSDTAHPGHKEAASAAEGARQRLSLRPLLTLKPLILAHKGALAGAVISLVVSALAMLAVPMAVRRMIDKGFGGNDSALINNYFLTLIGIGIIIAIASPARYYFVNWIGERVVADLRTKVFRAARQAWTGVFRSQSFRRDDEPPDGGHDADQDRRRFGAKPGSAQPHHADWRPDHDVRDERQTLGAHFHRHSDHRSAARRVRPPCPPPVALRPGYARRRFGLRGRKSRRASDDAGLRQRESCFRRGSAAPSSALSGRRVNA